ncbi:hypothetical protein PHLGIDRAFT_103418 [Phlebiopsis gigantea 11061_1 CR5-6]|uniref:FHF complex subunit HOOK-interacting protein C-terminal domain-containing protein n=1 Tax=Phlebiopsis gigantea (strain 11061_1 CR5-6) TaxID=745531 RepID=A0A0C3S1T4_PHLG1|nr:hypothetical protein PHLGIDRAFT_103418 [Phlebiopsis gigantea 11061_1 CR5-6]
MDYFSKFLRSGPQPPAKAEVDHAQEFHKSWMLVKNTLLYPDERQLARGIKATDVPARLQAMVDALVWESTRTEEGGTGACLEYLLKNDVLGTLVKLSEADRPVGIQAEVLRAVQNMVVLLDEQFLVHSVVHKAVLRLLRHCAGDDIQEQLDGRNRVVGAAGASTRSQPSEYEADLVNLLCILCSRIRNYRELLMIFFHDRHWYRPEPLFSVEEEDEEEEDEEEDHEDMAEDETITVGKVGDSVEKMQESPLAEDPAMALSAAKKPEYEFLLFNYLLRFIHREGQIGDFARAGLLFLMDVAMSPIDPGSSNAGSDNHTASVSSVSSVSDPTNDAALALAEYILDGDFSDVLAAGLAAVYSILPTKLEVRPPVQTEAPSGMILGGSSVSFTEEQREKAELEEESRRATGMEESSSSDFKSRLDHFLKLLEFLQDVLRRNVVQESLDESIDPTMLLGSAIVQAILGAVRTVFLENVLYPSILECSDSDGSAVAVMSYVDIMIRTLEDGQLGYLIVDFLTSEDNTEDLTRSRMRPRSTLDLSASAPPPAPSARATKMRRRKSTAMVLLEMEVPRTRQQSGYFTSMGRFTLKDLLLSSLRSSSPETVTASLQLLHTVLNQYCHLSVDKLFVVINDPFATSFPQPALLLPPTEGKPRSDDDEDEDEETFIYPGAQDESISTNEMAPSGPSSLFVQPDTSFWTHEKEMNLYLSLVSRVNPNHSEDAFSTGYDHYLRDALLTLEGQQCFQLDIDLKEREELKHRLNPSDPMLASLLESLRRFFGNTPELNMALTGVLSTLATCPDRSLAGWLTYANSADKNSTDDELFSSLSGYKDDGDDRSIDWRVEHELASRSHPSSLSTLGNRPHPVIYTIFHGLVSQLERYRQLVDDFDHFLQQRRQGLLFSENMTDALTLALDVESNVFTKLISPSPAAETAARPKPKSKPSSFVSFLTPRKRPTKQGSLDATVPRARHSGLEASPFAPHYQKTGAIVVEPYLAPAPSDGPWTPPQPKKWSADEADVLASSGQWGEGGFSQQERQPAAEREEGQPKVAHVTLSQLLDNVVILEECMKELVAIMHARRSLGIDSVRYL